MRFKNQKTILSCVFALSLSMLLLLACGQKEESKQVSPKLPPPKFALKNQVDDLKIDQQVVSFGGINLIGEVFKEIEKWINPLLPVPLKIEELWLNQYVLTHFQMPMAHVDFERPLRIVEMIDQKFMHSVRIIGFKDFDTFKQSLGKQLLEDQSKVDAPIYVLSKYENDPSPTYFYVDSTWQMMVSTTHAPLLAKKYRSFYDALFQSKFNGIGAYYYYPKHLLGLWDEDLEKAAEKKSQELKLQGSAIDQQHQKDMISKMAKKLEGLANDSERISTEIFLSEMGFKVKGSWSPKANSELAKIIEQLSVNPKIPPILEKLPTDIPFFVSLNLPKALFSAFHVGLNQNLNSPMSENLALFEQYLKSVMEVTQALDGEIAFIARKATITPEILEMQAQQDQKDQARQAEKKAKKLAEKMKNQKGNALDPKAKVDSKQAQKSKQKDQAKTKSNAEENGQENGQENQDSQASTDDQSTHIQPPILPNQSHVLSFASIFSVTDAKIAKEKQDQLLAFYQNESMHAMLNQLGVWVETMTDEKIVVEGMPSTRVVGKMAHLPRILNPIKPQLKEIYDAHILIQDRLGVIGFGMTWFDTLTGFFKGIFKGGLLDQAGVKNAFAQGANHPFLMVYFEPFQFIQHLKRAKAGSTELPLQMIFGHVENQDGLSFSLGTQKGQFEGVLDLPYGLIKNLVKAVYGQLGGGLMMPNSGLPPAGQGLDTLPPAGQGLDALPPAGQGLDPVEEKKQDQLEKND